MSIEKKISILNLLTKEQSPVNLKFTIKNLKDLIYLIALINSMFFYRTTAGLHYVTE